MDGHRRGRQPVVCDWFHPASPGWIPYRHRLSCDTPAQVIGHGVVGTYGLRMGTTGLIYAAIAAAWLAYLVPTFLKRQGNEPAEDEDPSNRFSDSMRIVLRGTAPLLDQDGDEIDSVEISTPLTRRAAVADLQRLEALAAKRRRRVLLTLMVGLTAVVSVCLAGLVSWRWVAIPGVLLVSFVVLARVSVRGMRRGLDRRYRAINRGSDESTVFLSRPELKDAAGKGSIGDWQKSADGHQLSRGALWDPLPITLPTYVSKPLAPRTVRTIDLSSPEVTTSARRSGGLGAPVPVTADRPHEMTAPTADIPDNAGDELPQAVGE